MKIEVGDRVKVSGKKATGDRFGWTSSMEKCRVGVVRSINQEDDYADVILDDIDMVFPRRYVISDLEKVNK